MAGSWLTVWGGTRTRARTSSAVAAASKRMCYWICSHCGFRYVVLVVHVGVVLEAVIAVVDAGSARGRSMRGSWLVRLEFSAAGYKSSCSARIC